MRVTTKFISLALFAPVVLGTTLPGLLSPFVGRAGIPSGPNAEGRSLNVRQDKTCIEGTIACPVSDAICCPIGAVCQDRNIRDAGNIWCCPKQSVTCGNPKNTENAGMIDCCDVALGEFCCGNRCCEKGGYCNDPATSECWSKEDYEAALAEHAANGAARSQICAGAALVAGSIAALLSV